MGNTAGTDGARAVGVDDGEETPLAAWIARRRGRILERWAGEARPLARSAGAEGHDPVDLLTPLLEGIVVQAARLARGEGPRGDAPCDGPAPAPTPLPLGALVEAYARLRPVLQADLAEAAPDGAGGRVQPRELDAAIDAAIGAAAAAFSRSRDRLLGALDRISLAARGATSLDDRLERLLAVVLEAEPCADTAALLVREGKVLRVAAAVGLEQGEADGAFVDLGRGFAGRIAAERRPLALRAACTDPLVTSARLRGRGVQALYGVPLMAGDELLGIATVGSISRPEFPEELKALFRTVAARAATILWGAALLERERRACARAALLEEELRALEAARAAAGSDPAAPRDAPTPLQ